MIDTIVGIDLSFRNTGVAVLTLDRELNPTVAQLLQFSTNSKESDIDCCLQLYLQFESFFIHLSEETSDYCLAAELPTWSRDVKAAKYCGMATALLAPYLIGTEDELKMYSPRAIAKFVGQGDIKGAARKKLNITKAYELYPEAPWLLRKGLPMAKEEHKADALLLAHLALLELREGLNT